MSRLTFLAIDALDLKEIQQEKINKIQVLIVFSCNINSYAL